MYRKLIVILVLCIASAMLARGQKMSFREVDSLTYRHYLDGNWNELLKVGKKAQKQGYEFYYLNIRMGIAGYKTASYYVAEKYLKKALNQNAYSLIAQEYLFWTYRELGDDLRASQVFKELPDSIQKRVRFKKINPVHSIFAEGGVKFSGQDSIAGNVYYANGGLQHKLGNRFMLTHSYSFFTQYGNNWGEYNQHQYFMGGELYLNKGWRLHMGLHYVNYKSDLTYLNQFTIYQPGPPPPPGQTIVVDSQFVHNDQFAGNYELNSLASSLGFSKNWGRFSLTGFVNFMYEWEDNNYTINVQQDITASTYDMGTLVSETTDFREFTDTFDQKANRWTLVPGIAAHYTLPFWQDRITLGLRVMLPFNADTLNRLNITPFLSTRITKWLWFSGNYMYKSYLPVMNEFGDQYFSTYDEIVHRATISFKALVVRRLLISLTYQYDEIFDSLTRDTYQLNSILLGLKLKL